MEFTHRLRLFWCCLTTTNLCLNPQDDDLGDNFFNMSQRLITGVKGLAKCLIKIRVTIDPLSSKKEPKINFNTSISIERWSK